MGVTTAVRRSLSLTVMLGISAIACAVIAAISLVQYRETRAALQSVQVEEGRQLAVTLATSVAAIAAGKTSEPRLDRGTLEGLLGSIVDGTNVAEIAVVDRAGTIVARASAGSDTSAAAIATRVAPVLAN